MGLLVADVCFCCLFVCLLVGWLVGWWVGGLLWLWLWLLLLLLLFKVGCGVRMCRCKFFCHTNADVWFVEAVGLLSDFHN